MVTEKVLLSIVTSLKEFQTILISQWSKIYTNQKILLVNIFNNDRILRCRLILEKYGTYIEYFQG